MHAFPVHPNFERESPPATSSRLAQQIDCASLLAESHRFNSFPSPDVDVSAADRPESSKRPQDLKAWGRGVAPLHRMARTCSAALAAQIASVVAALLVLHIQIRSEAVPSAVALSLAARRCAKADETVQSAKQEAQVAANTERTSFRIYR